MWRGLLHFLHYDQVRPLYSLSFSYFSYDCKNDRTFCLDCHDDIEQDKRRLRRSSPSVSPAQDRFVSTRLTQSMAIPKLHFDDEMDMD